MAGDWIKMRGALLEHPKLIRMAKRLQDTTEFRAWLAPGGPLNEKIVGDSALRYVTASALLKVWSGAREHGKTVGDDLVLEHSTLADLDEMAGVPGVGQAMAHVQWAVNANGVTLPNFIEFNVPLSVAERQRDFRARQAVKRNQAPLPPVTNRVTRVEKSREELKTKAQRFAPPDWLPLEAWKAFEDMRAKLRKPLTDRARELAVAKLVHLKAGGNDPAAVLEQSVLGGWAGLFELKPENAAAARPPAALRKCGYCGKNASGSVGSVWHCDAHSLDAMDGKPTT